MRHDSTNRVSIYAAIMISVASAVILTVALTALATTLVASEKMGIVKAEYAVTVIQISASFVSCYIASKANNKLIAGIAVAVLLTLLVITGLVIGGEGAVIQWGGLAGIILGAAGAMILRITRNRRNRSAVKKVRYR